MTKKSERKLAKVGESKARKSGEIDAKKVCLLIFAGALIGLVNGFFGGGGGMICVPLLEKVLQLDNKYSHATAIAVILPISFVSACIYLVSGTLETKPLLSVTAGVVLGGVIGSFALKIMPSRVVRIIFALVMLAGGVRMIW